MDSETSQRMSDFIEIIGLMVTNASSFDYKLGTLLSESFCLTATQENVMLRPLGTRAKIEIVQRLGKYIHNNGDEAKPISKWCQEAKARFEDRNTVIHGCPGINKEGKVCLRLYSAGNAFGGDAEEWSAARVRSIALAIRDLEKQITSLLQPAFDTWTQAFEQYLATDFVPSLVLRRHGKNL